MDSQRVKVLHVADCDAVVKAVSYHLVLYLLPALEGFLHQNLRREGEGLGCQLLKFTVIVAESAAQSSKCVGRPHNYRVTQLTGCLKCILYILNCVALNGLNLNLIQFLYK